MVAWKKSLLFARGPMLDAGQAISTASQAQALHLSQDLTSFSRPICAKVAGAKLWVARGQHVSWRWPFEIDSALADSAFRGTADVLSSWLFFAL